MKRRLYRSQILFAVTVLQMTVSTFSEPSQREEGRPIPSAGQPEAIRVLASNGVRAALQDLIPQWERAVGRPLRVEFNTSAAIKRKIEANDLFDVTVLTTDVIDSVTGEGKLAAHVRSEIGRIGVGIGVIAGAATPDIHTADTIKQTLLNAKSTG